MIPILYPQSETAFVTNGIGRLSDAVSCTVTEERNGIFECELQYPVTGRHYDQITEGRIIYCTHDETHIPQPFEIYARSAVLDGIVTFNARHITYRLLNVVAEPHAYVSATEFFSSDNGIAAHCLNECPFTFSTNRSLAGNMTIKAPMSVRAALAGVEGSALDVYGPGEYRWNKWSVEFLTARGTARDISIRYGKNLLDLEYNRDDSDTYDAAIPFWTSPEGDVVTLPEWVVPSGHSPVYMEAWTDHGGNVIKNEDEEDIEFRYAVEKSAALDLTEDFEEEPTFAQMRAKARSKMTQNQTWLPSENLVIDFVALWQTDEYAEYAPLERVQLCDTVNVAYDALGVNVRKKVIRTVYNSLLERYNEIELGDNVSTYADIIGSRTEHDVFGHTVTPIEMNRAIYSATKMITGGAGGYIYYNIVDGQTREIYAMDTDDISTAQNVLRINSNGIGFSNSGVNGPYTQAWTIDGVFNGNFIRAGRISSYDASTFFDLAAGWLVTTRSDVTDIYKDSIMFRNASLLMYRTDELMALITSGEVEDESSGAGRKSLLIGCQAWNSKFRGISIGRLDPNARKVHPVLKICNVHHGYDEDVIFTEKVRAAKAIYLGLNDEEIRINVTNDLNWIYLSYDTYVAGECSVTTLIQRSDERLKNIWQWDDRYDEIIDQLTPMLYTWKTGKDTKRKHVGVSAQKLRDILTQAGITDSGMVTEAENQLCVNYTDLSMLLLKRVQDQQKRIDDLEARLARLEALLDANS